MGSEMCIRDRAWIEENIDTELVVNGRLESQIAEEKAKVAAEKAAREQEQEDA